MSLNLRCRVPIPSVLRIHCVPLYLVVQNTCKLWLEPKRFLTGWQASLRNTIESLQRASTNRQKEFIDDLGISHGWFRTLLCRVVSHLGPRQDPHSSLMPFVSACFVSGYANALSLCKTSWMTSSPEPAQVCSSSVIEDQSWKDFQMMRRKN